MAGGFGDEAGFAQSAELGADLVAGHAGNAGDGGDFDGVPGQGDGIEDALLLDGQSVHNGFEIGGELVEQAFEVGADIAAQAFSEESVESLDEAGIAAGEQVEALDCAGAFFQGFGNGFVAAGFSESEQGSLHFLESERAEIEDAEEIVERLVEVGDLVEVPGGGAEEHDAGIIHEEGAKAVERFGVVDGGEEIVEIVDEEQGASAAAVHFFEKGIAGGVFDVGSGFVEQLLGAVFGVIGGVFPLAESFEPEISEVADAAAFLIENDREPLPGQYGIVLYGVGDGPEGSGLSHAARADQKRVLEGLAGALCRMISIKELSSGRRAVNSARRISGGSNAGL